MGSIVINTRMLSPCPDPRGQGVGGLCSKLFPESGPSPIPRKPSPRGLSTDGAARVLRPQPAVSRLGRSPLKGVPVADGCQCRKDTFNTSLRSTGVLAHCRVLPWEKARRLLPVFACPLASPAPPPGGSAVALASDLLDQQSPTGGP